MTTNEIEAMILEDIRAGAYFDLYEVERVAERIAARFAALEAENARLRESAELNADYHRREMKLQTEIASLALEESSALRAENDKLRCIGLLRMEI